MILLIIFGIISLVIIIAFVDIAVEAYTKSKAQKKPNVSRIPKIDNRTQRQKETDCQAAWDKWNKARGAKKEFYEEKYGECSIYTQYKDGFFYVFEQSKIIILNEDLIPFQKIISYSLVDNKKTIKENVEYESTTTTSTGSMIGRAVVGGILSGGVGAAIGAATAKKNTVTTPLNEYDTTIIRHDFKIYINVNDLSCPTLMVHIGDNTDKAYKIANILNVIIERNRYK